MEIVWGAVGLVVVWWGWGSIRAQRSQRALALRRIHFHERQGEFSDEWDIDFIEMRMLYRYRVYDYPGVETDVVYALRRCGESHWEKQMLPESAEVELQQLERDAQEFGFLSEKMVEERRQALLALRDTWTRVGAQMEAQIDTQYRLFLARYEPAEPGASLEEFWRRIIAIRREKEQRRGAAKAVA